MSGRYGDYRSRSFRAGRGRRGEKETDTIVLALTAQILVCVILLLVAGTVKKVSPENYDAVKGQYSTMTTDQSQNAQLGELFSSQGRGILAAIENAFHFIFGKITGTYSEPYMENAVAVDIQDKGEGDGEGFSYNYIDPPVVQGAAGGLFEVSVFDGKYLEAPAGTTLAPVYLAGSIIAPVEGLITSPFAYRYHPISGKTDFHTGLDVAAEEGRSILAALPGEVVEVGNDEIYGNYIVLQHATHLKTFYAHCSEIIAQEGMAVNQGERIAKVGQTGVATGPHLHFSVIVDDVYTNPEWVLESQIQLVE